MNPLITLIAGLGIGFLIAFYAVTHWNNVKLFISDILRFVGFFCKWIRKKSVEEKYEAVINSAIDEFNSNFEDKMLPGCSVNWIDGSLDESYLEDNKAIVCLRFNKKDQDLNFYNATYSFTKTGLLPKTRHFIKKNSQKAIDLNLTKLILKNYQRRSLRVFNEKFKNEADQVRESFQKLEETEKRGLFRSLLIPELHYLGETLETTTPSKKIEQEIENFLDWFCDLATREKFENTNLNYNSPNLKVGVILVANLETYQHHGAEAYTKWAEKYASENYGAIYLLARGVQRSKMLKEIVDELVDSKGFDQVNKKVSAFEVYETGEQVEIFCYCLKPNTAKIQYQAWEKLKQHFELNKLVNGIVKLVEGDQIIVNAYGRDIGIPKDKLSSEKITHIYKYFKPEQELLLKIEKFGYEEAEISLSNIGTDTDPKIIIDNTLGENKAFKVIVDSVQLDDEGRERGLVTYCREIRRRVFVPKSKCSYSRFINLKKEFKLGQELSVQLHSFGYQFGNFIGELEGLVNPWLSIEKYSEGGIYKSKIQEINKTFVTTELIPGLECRIYRNELSWDGSVEPKQLNVDDDIDIVLIKIDRDRYKTFGSLKRVKKSGNQIFWDENGKSIFEGTVTKVVERIGVEFRAEEFDISGFVYVGELMWGFCSKIETIFPVDSNINVRAVSYNINKNELEFSIRQCQQNDFKDVVKTLAKGQSYKGKILRHVGDICQVELSVANKVVQCYVHKSEVSNKSFVTPADFPKYLPIDSEFSFRTKRVDKRNKIFELSRKKHLALLSEVTDFENPISMRVIRVEYNGAIAYSDNAEGRITINYHNLEQGSMVKAYPINSNGEYQV